AAASTRNSMSARFSRSGRAVTLFRQGRASVSNDTAHGPRSIDVNPDWGGREPKIVEVDELEQRIAALEGKPK
ncbi:MAG: hypothetical protein ABW205_08650, partial [Burkholderiales bacterium]